MRLLISDPGIYSGGSAIFLDRDGVINRQVVGDYVRDWQSFFFLPGVLRAVKSLSSLPVPIIVVSNQAGVAKGVMSEGDLRALTIAFIEQVADYGGRIDAVYYCIHHPSQQCECRKPRPGLLRYAASEWNLNLTECFMIGDSETDIIAGASAGCKTILVKGSASPQLKLLEGGCLAADDLGECSSLLLTRMGCAESTSAFSLAAALA